MKPQAPKGIVRNVGAIVAIVGGLLLAGVLGAALSDQDAAQKVPSDDGARVQIQRLQLESTLDSLSSLRVLPERRRLVPEVGARYETQHGVAAFYWVGGQPQEVLDGYLEELARKGWTVEGEPTMVLPEAKDDGTQIGSLVATAVKGQARIFVYASENFKDPDRGGTRLQVRMEPKGRVPAAEY